MPFKGNTFTKCNLAGWAIWEIMAIGTAYNRLERVTDFFGDISRYLSRGCCEFRAKAGCKGGKERVAKFVGPVKDRKQMVRDRIAPGRDLDRESRPNAPTNKLRHPGVRASPLHASA
jgi:predicted Rdx family selenoprotein